MKAVFFYWILTMSLFAHADAGTDVVNRVADAAAAVENFRSIYDQSRALGDSPTCQARASKFCRDSRQRLETQLAEAHKKVEELAPAYFTRVNFSNPATMTRDELFAAMVENKVKMDTESAKPKPDRELLAQISANSELERRLLLEPNQRTVQEPKKLRRAEKLDDLSGKSLVQSGTAAFGAEGWDQQARTAFNPTDRKSDCRVTVLPVASNSDWLKLQDGTEPGVWKYGQYSAGPKISPPTDVQVDPVKAGELCESVPRIFTSECTKTLMSRGTYYSASYVTLNDNEGRTVTVYAKGLGDSVLKCMDHFGFNLDVPDDKSAPASSSQGKLMATDTGVSR